MATFYSVGRDFIARVPVDKSEAVPVFLIDRSYSMDGHYERMVRYVIPDALEFAGVSEARMVTFSTGFEVFPVMTVEEFRDDRSKTNGGTKAAGGIGAVLTLIEKLGDVHLVVVSDGEIYDKKESLDVIEHISKTNTALSVTAVCIGGGADLTILSALAALSASAVPVIELVDCRRAADPIGDALSLGGSVRVTAGGGLRRVATDSESGCIHVSARTPFLLVSGDTDLSTFRVGGHCVNVTINTLESEDSILEYVQFLNTRIRSTIVSCGNVDSLLDWLENVQQSVDVIRTDGMSSDIRVRLKLLKRVVSKRSKGLISSVMQLRNVENVARMNNRQKAAFLRGASGKGAKSLARRAGTFDLSMVTSAVAMPRKLRDDGDSGEVSFYGHDTFRDGIEVAREVPEGAIPSDVLTLVGGLGVPFHLYQGNLPDPWSAVVTDVYPGLFLSEQDLRQAMIDGGGRPLEMPGQPGKFANGVVPLEYLDPPAYYEYMRGSLRPVARVHASVTLRGMMAPVPQDTLARDALVMLHLAGQRNRTAIGNRILRELTYSVGIAMSSTYQAAFRPIAAAIKAGDRTYFTGENGIGSSRKLMATLMAHPDLAECRKPGPDRERALDAIYGFSVQLAARRHFKGKPDERDAEIRRVCQIDPSIMELKPLFKLDQPWQAIVPAMSVDLPEAMDTTGAISWVPDLEEFCTQVHAFGQDERFEIDIFGTSPKMLRMNAVITSLFAPTEKDVVSDGEMKVPLLGSPTDCGLFLQTGVCEIYREIYGKNVAKKAAAEARDLADRAVAMAAKCDLSNFMGVLNVIPYRDSLGYGELWKAVLAARDVDKLWILILGRDKDLNVVWNKGSVLVSDYRPLAILFAEEGKVDMWSKLMSARKKYGIHKYRDLPNRHGHSNDNPSFWAYGYRTIDEFKETVTDDEYQRYIKQNPQQA